MGRRHILIVIARSLIYLVQFCMDISSFSGILQEIPPSLSCLRLEDLKSLVGSCLGLDRKSTRLNSSHLGISYAVFCLKKKKKHKAHDIKLKNIEINRRHGHLAYALQETIN